MSLRMSRSAALVLFAAISAVPCFAHHMAVVGDKDNSVGNVSSTHLARIFRSEVKKWPDGKDVVLLLHKSSSGEMITLEHLTKMSAAELKSLIAAHKNSILMVDSDADLLKLVESTPGAVGFVDVRSVTSGVNVVWVDGKLPMEDGYLPH